MIAPLRKWKEPNKPSLFLSFILFLRPACYRSSKTRSQKFRPTFVPACTKPSWLQISIGKILDGPEYKDLASEFAHQLAQKAQLRKSLRKNLRFVGAKRSDKSTKFCVICVCVFHCPSSWTAGEGSSTKPVWKAPIWIWNPAKYCKVISGLISLQRNRKLNFSSEF